MADLSILVEKARNGDSESMNTVLVFFKPKVSAICREYFLIGSDFDDILQEGMIGLYKAIQNYDKTKNDSFPHFASMCIHRQIQSAIKVANSKKNIPLNDYFSINNEGGVESKNDSPPQIMLVTKDRIVEKFSLDKEKNSNFIKEIKNNLNEEQYKVLCLYLNGYSYNEIATLIGLNSKRIDNLIQTIKRKLKKVVSDN